MGRILLIDDDDELFELLKVYLAGEGFSCECAMDAEEGLRMAQEHGFDVLILDVMLPGMSGFEVLRQLRAQEKTQSLPVLMLSAKGEEVDRVIGLEMGADDYLSKPFSTRELVARLRALLRRSPPVRAPEASSWQTFGDISIDRASLCVSVDNEQQELSLPEMRLLLPLLQGIGAVVSRDQLSLAAFGHQSYYGDRSLDMLVSRLRKKLGQRPGGGTRIKAVRGEGYMYLLGGDAP